LHRIGSFVLRGDYSTGDRRRRSIRLIEPLCQEWGSRSSYSSVQPWSPPTRNNTLAGTFDLAVDTSVVKYWVRRRGLKLALRVAHSPN
jgi:hypothetical protein